MRMRIAGALGAAGMVGMSVWAGAAAPAVAAPSEADLAYHGVVAMTAGQVDVLLTPQNHGPADVLDATVRLRWSRPLAQHQRLPEGCARYNAATVLCDTGPLAAGSAGRQIHLRVGLADASADEVRLQIDTLWDGGAADREPRNDRRRVLALDTGDEYSF